MEGGPGHVVTEHFKVDKFQESSGLEICADPISIDLFQRPRQTDPYPALESLPDIPSDCSGCTLFRFLCGSADLE